LDCKQVSGSKILKVYPKLFQFENIHLCRYEKCTFILAAFVNCECCVVLFRIR
jgi:hypothetical protein